MNNLKKIFEDEYKGCDFIYENIITKVFKNVKDQRATQDKIDELSESDKKQINSVRLFAQCSRGAEISFFDIEIKNSVNLPKSRVAIQNCVKKIINSQSCAIIFFHYADNKSIWRVSFTYVGKTIKDSTNAKRYTYICGINQHCRTITERFTNLSLQERITDNDVIDAFAVQSLSEDFFAEYKVFYEDFVQFITGNRYLKKGAKWEKTPIHVPNPIFEKFITLAKKESLKQVQGESEESITELAQKKVRDYIKKMMGRLVFLQYLQKKGWLGVQVQNEWGTGDKSYTQNLFLSKTQNQQEDFLEKVLEPLFFETLNKKRPGDIADKILQIEKNQEIKIPYLNGGLFEKEELDEIKIKFPKELFCNTDSKYKEVQRVYNEKHSKDYDYTKAQGLLDFFAQYNFTIDETDPSDVEIGVDPEMLGKIFENLLEDNKDKGAFYTPKEIVEYMCQESLIAYLSSESSDTDFTNKIPGFVKNPHDKNDFTESEKNIILQKLRNVKICDPAIGSGAFPMGMMNILYSCRAAIEHEDDICKIKKEIVKNNIYGVDIEKGAVDIARLRFWLSIIVDETKPLPLPNLDYKLMQGNSLIESFESVDLSNITKPDSMFDEEKDINDLVNMLKNYFDTTEEKNAIKDGIKSSVIDLLKNRGITDATLEKLENLDLHQNSDFFLWHTWFNDVFNRSNDSCNTNLGEESLPLAPAGKPSCATPSAGDTPATPPNCHTDLFAPNGAHSGFDIVIGNPPYGAKLKESDKTFCKKNFVTTKTIKDVQKGSMDSYTLFIEKGFNLIKKNGNLAYIIPISITSSDAVSGVHKLLLDNCENIKISSYAVRPQPVFEHAVVNTSILMFTKTETPCKNLYSTKMHRKGNGFILQNLIDSLEFAEVLKYKKFGRIPKISKSIEQDILNNLLNYKTITDYLDDKGNEIFYRAAGGRYFKVITPYTNNSSAEKTILVKEKFSNSIACMLSSSLSFWFYQIYSDNLNWKACEITSFPIPNLTDNIITKLEKLYNEYLKDIEANAMVQKSSGNSSYKVSEFKVYKIGKSKSIIDQIDDLICPLYGLSKEETEFIKNYEIEFRLSDDE